MKIVQLCPYAMDRPGGVQRHVRDLAAWLTAQGHETRILCPPRPGAAPASDGAVTRLGRAWSLAVHGTAFEVSWASPWAVRRAAAELRGWGADLVHLHTPWTPFLVAQLARALDLPRVTTVHATLPAPEARGAVERYIRWSARRLLPQSQALIVPSKAPLSMLRSLLPSAPVQIVPPAIDLAPWRAAASARIAGGSDLSLMFLGRFEPRKGLDVLLKAWPRIAAALPEARLTVAGDGPMRALVQSAVSDRLRLVIAPDDAKAQRLLATSDLFLAPAPYGESFGLVLAEAMAAGSLPIAAANPGYAAVLKGPGARLLVPPGDAEALAKKVIAFANPTARTGLIAWAKTCADAWDINLVGSTYLSIYQSVTDRN